MSFSSTTRSDTSLLQENQMVLKRIYSLLIEAGVSAYANDYEGRSLFRAYELCREQIKLNEGIKEF